MLLPSQLQLLLFSESPFLSSLFLLNKRVLKGLKGIGRIYGADVDESLDKLEAKLVDANASGNEATVEVNYVLLDKEISFEIEMTRIDDRWYPADSVQDARQELKQALPAAAVSAP